jgi:tRNA1(Val) A37 N6-methylase TrmN6
MTVKLEERSVYNYVADFLQSEFGAKTLIEGRIGKGYVDIFFALDSSSFVLEIKLGKPEKKLADAIAQSWKYASDLNTRNVVALVLSRVQSGQTILIENLPKLKEIILNEVVEGYVHTDYWEKWVENRTLKDVLIELYQRFYKKESEFDFNSIVKAIREIVQDLNDVIRQAKTEEIFEEVAEKLELFVGLGEIKDKQKAMGQVSMLASYLLFNQLLFYHIYRIKTKDERIKDLEPVNSIKDLQKYFSQIVEIDYQPIYAINLIDKIPDNSEVLELINKAIKNLLVIRVEHVTKDLAGRFFHALLPKEVAKVWAAFYTNPIAAEILAHLAIDRWDETVLDPACGSGTLLVACYKRKLDLHKEEKEKELDEKTIESLHKKFIEEDITGIDIMPFAAHLTTINLSAQKLEQTTNIVRIACMDSLELAPKTQNCEFKEKGLLLKPLIERVQLTLVGKKVRIKKDRTIAPSGLGKEFYIKPVDVIIMNPPFSDREKLPKDYLERLSDNSEFGKLLGRICGHQINLWGYFLALADLMLKPNGKIATVVPINIARGKATEKIRNYLLENYYIKYIVKSTKDLAFSESAAFRDILLVAEKRKPKDDDLTTIIFLKKSIREMDFYKVKEIVSNISSNVESTEDYEMQKLSTSQLLHNKNNFMKFLRGTSLERNKVILKFLEKIENKSKNKLINLSPEEMLEGFHASPAGLSQLVFVVNPIDESRTERNVLLILKKVEDSYIKTEQPELKKEFKIEKHKVAPAVKTLTGIKTMNITSSHDFLIIDNFKNFRDLMRLSKWKGKFNWKEVRTRMEGRATYVAILHRINIFSRNTYFVSCFSEKQFYTTHAFNIFPHKSKEESKFLCLFFNSIVGFLQILTLMKETTGQYIEFMQSDLEEVKVLKLEALSQTEKSIVKTVWNKVSNVEFPSLLEQLEKRFWARVELDKAILKILGFSDKEIEEWLPKVYDVIVEELKAIKEIK